MKLFKYTFLILFVLMSQILPGQYSGFDLGRYKLPDIKLNRLDASFNASDALNTDHYKPSFSDSTKSATNTFQGSVNLDFYHFRNSEKYQGNIDISGNVSIYNYRNKPDDSETKIRHNNLILQSVSVNRFYNKKLNFIEADPYISFARYSDRNYYETSPASTQDASDGQSSVNISVPVSVGHGRIEPVEDLRLAIYILEELKKVNKIDSLPSDNQILEMARVISKIKRQRFFDTRLRKIRELHVIDSFLVVNKIVSSNNIDYFAVLNDQWDFAAGPSRSAGFALNIGIDDNVEFIRERHTLTLNGGDPSKAEFGTNTWDLGAFCEVNYHKPVNLYWQTSVSFRTSYGVEYLRYPEDQNIYYDNYKSKVLNTSISYSVQYLPNSRTSIGLSLSGSYRNQTGGYSNPNPIPGVFRFKNQQFLANAVFNMYYYISPQFRIQFSSQFYYIMQSTRDTDNSQDVFSTITNSLHQASSVTLIYSFF